MRKYVKGLTSLFIVLYAANSWAELSPANYEALVQNLIVSDSIYPQGQSNIMITGGSYYLNQSDEKDLLFPFYVAYGLSDSLTLTVQANTFLLHDVSSQTTFSGIDSLSGALQYSMMHINQSNYSLGLIFSYLYPIGNVDKGITDGFSVYDPVVLITRDFPSLHNSQFFTEVGFDFYQRVKNFSHPQDNVPLTNDILMNAGYFFPVGNWRYDLEINWINDEWNHNGTDNELYITPGLIWVLTETIELEAGVSIGLTPSSDNADVIFRVSFAT